MNCVICKKEFVATSNRSKYCSGCRDFINKERMKEYHLRTYVRKGYNQKGVNNNAYKNGISTYRNLVEHGFCVVCETNTKTLTHHIDEDRNNNTVENLAPVCKRCHQILHDCQKALPKKQELSALKKAQSLKAKRDARGRFVLQGIV